MLNTEELSFCIEHSVDSVRHSIVPVHTNALELFGQNNIHLYFAPSNRKSRVADIKEVGNISILTPMKEYRNIKYTYYDRRNGQGPYSSTHNGYCPSQSSYSSIEDMLQKTHPDYCRITVLDYDVVGQRLINTLGQAAGSRS